MITYRPTLNYIVGECLGSDSIPSISVIPSKINTALDLPVWIDDAKVESSYHFKYSMGLYLVVSLKVTGLCAKTLMGKSFSVPTGHHLGEDAQSSLSSRLYYSHGCSPSAHVISTVAGVSDVKEQRLKAYVEKVVRGKLHFGLEAEIDIRLKTFRSRRGFGTSPYVDLDNLSPDELQSVTETHKDFYDLWSNRNFHDGEEDPSVTAFSLAAEGLTSYKFAIRIPRTSYQQSY